MSTSLSNQDDGTGPVPCPEDGTYFFEKEAEKLWIETQVPKLIRIIRRSDLMTGDGELSLRAQMNDHKTAEGSQLVFEMLFLSTLPIDFEMGMKPDLREIRKIVRELNSVLRRKKMTKLNYLFEELLRSPISQVVLSDNRLVVSRRGSLDPSLLDELAEAGRNYRQSDEDLSQLGERVVLSDQGQSPSVLGEPKRKMTRPQYHVVKALLDAGKAGLTKDELVSKSGHEDARGILKRLADSDPDWKAVIHFAGITGGRYRIK